MFSGMTKGAAVTTEDRLERMEATLAEVRIKLAALPVALEALTQQIRHQNGRVKTAEEWRWEHDIQHAQRFGEEQARAHMSRRYIAILAAIGVAALGIVCALATTFFQAMLGL